MTDFYDAVRRRRMVRNYTDDPVDPDALERILNAARKAPSAGFSQGQAMLVVAENEGRREIARLAGENEYVAMGMDPWISKAPVHVIVCVSKNTYFDRYAETDKKGEPNTDEDWPVPYWWVDAGATMMLLLLAVVAEGLAAGFLGSHRMPELKESFGIPDHMDPIGIVTIGHAAPDRRSGSLDRGWKAEDEVIHRERW
jgi:nitroreductase